MRSLRRLPVPVAPFTAETVGSYLARMAAANHLDPVVLARHLHAPDTPGTGPDLLRLAAVSGTPAPTLVRALPELGRHHPVSTGARPRLACQSCAAARGITRPVTRWVHAHPDVCLRHRRWIGPTVSKLADQHDLTRLPDVVAAARRHHKLVHRHGPLVAATAYRHALYVNLRWAEQRCLGRHRDRRLGLLPGSDMLSYEDPALHLAVYPETVALASLMVDTQWVSAAASSLQYDKVLFYAEVVRRLELPEYRAGSRYDPLDDWVKFGSRLALAELLQSPKCATSTEHTAGSLAQ